MALILGNPQQQNPQNPAATQFNSSPQGSKFNSPEFSAAMGAPQQNAPKKTDDAQIKEIAQDISSMTRRFRVLEERYMNMRKRVQLMDQNILANNKRMVAEIKSAEEELANMGRKTDDIKEKFVLMQKELETCVKKQELEVVKKYINMWNPINFINHQEAEKLIRKVIESSKTGEKVERYPVYEPQNEEEDKEVQKKHAGYAKTEKESRDTAEESEANEKNSSEDDSSDDEEYDGDEESYEENDNNDEGNSQEKKEDRKGKVDLDDITNILHKHSPF